MLYGISGERSIKAAALAKTLQSDGHKCISMVSQEQGPGGCWRSHISKASPPVGGLRRSGCHCWTPKPLFPPPSSWDTLQGVIKAEMFSDPGIKGALAVSPRSASALFLQEAVLRSASVGWEFLEPMVCVLGTTAINISEVLKGMFTSRRVFVISLTPSRNLESFTCVTN